MNTIQKTYTKQDIVKRVATLTHVDRKTAGIFVNHVFTALRDIMTSDDPSLRIEVRDFGILEVKPTKSKPKARNPKSGEIIYIPARRKTHFKPGKLLKKFLSQPLSIDP
ncbi:MAG: HU family DNA-binding protein, partial [Bacteroidota bacterium]|nr:HU family DNA-binding protein [Bacteroidota bacterium]